MLYQLINQETSRLQFRLLERSDFNTWMEFCKNEQAAKFVGMANIANAKERCESWFDEIEHRYANDLGAANVIIQKATGEFVGLCGLIIQEVDETKELEIAYSILPKFWGQGFASEAAQQCRDFAFKNKFADSLISMVHIDNIRSERVARKIGMMLSKNTTFENMPINVFRITRKEWEVLSV